MTTTTTPKQAEVGNVSMSTNTTPIINNYGETKNNSNSGNHNNNMSLTTNCSTTSTQKLHQSQHHHNERFTGGDQPALIATLSSMSSSQHRKHKRQQSQQNYSKSDSNPLLTSVSSSDQSKATNFSNQIMFYTSFRVLLDEMNQSKFHLFNTRITWLLLFGPLAIIGSWTGAVKEDMLFLFAGIALIPCAER